jgi:hypothetical protein
VPWYSIVKPRPDGRHELIVRIKCADDAHAADDRSADMFPGAEVWEGKRFVAALPPRHFPRGPQADSVVTLRPVLDDGAVQARRLVTPPPPPPARASHSPG